MKAIVESIGAVGSRVRLGDHNLVFDQPVIAPGGQNRGPSPLDVMAASVAACAHYYAAVYLHTRGLSAAGLTVDVETEKQRTPVPRLARLALTVHLPAGLSDQQTAGIARAIKSCPAYGTLLHPPTVDVALEPATPAHFALASAGADGDPTR